MLIIRKPMDTVAINNPPDDQQKVKMNLIQSLVMC